MAMYCGGEALAVNTDTGKAEDDLHLRLDAQRLFRDLNREGSPEARALHLSLAGLSLQGIAHVQAVSISTAHARVAGGLAALRASRTLTFASNAHSASASHP